MTMIAGLFASVVAGGLIVSWMVAGALVAPRPGTPGPPPSDLPVEAFTVASSSGSAVAGWHCRQTNSHGVIVLVHGIRRSRRSMLDRARCLRDLGYSSVMIDLHAHGESPGDCITLGHLEQHDVRAAVEFARDRHAGEPIAVIGVSLGGAAALLAAPLNIDALVLESVFPDIRSAVCNRVSEVLGPISWIPSELLLAQLSPRLGISPHQLRPIDFVAHIGCPVFVVSGAADQHTTAAETQQLFAQAQEPRQLWLVDGAAHVDLYDAAPELYRKHVGEFLRKHLLSHAVPLPWDEIAPRDRRN